MANSLQARCVFLGAPGAGKGTQAKRVAEKAEIAHISTGDMLREEVKSGSALGAEAKAYMDDGKLVPDQLIIDMVKARIEKPDAASAWILDGFPRTLPQAEALDQNLSGDNALTHVISFAVPEAALMGRLTGRRTCSQCGAIWHIEHNPTSKDGVCDLCGGELTQRSDDREEAIGKRLEVYRTQTAPLLAYYGDRGVLRELDANRAPDVVFQELLTQMQ
ncbi:MAG: adenylate kinase [Planctomycetota bacterium]|nr:adenylate kinase [Planctomycetota bacterium]MEC8651278.1 adenylate kinase [Planctomycetota bacterium]